MTHQPPESEMGECSYLKVGINVARMTLSSFRYSISLKLYSQMVTG